MPKENNYEFEQSNMENQILHAIERNKRLNKSGIIQMMNPQFHKCNYEETSLTLKFDIKEWELNPEMTMHGGLIATALDTTLGILSHYIVDKKYVTTITLTTTYLKPILKDDIIYVNAKADSIGRKIVNLSGNITLEREGKTITAATASGSFYRLNLSFVE